MYSSPTFQPALRTSHGRRPPGTAGGGGGGGVAVGGVVGGIRLGVPGTAMGGQRGSTGLLASSLGGRPVTGSNADGVNRPMTGIRGAG